MARDFFNNLIDKLFSRSGDQGAAQALVSEPLKRSQAYEAAYSTWLHSGRRLAMLDTLRQQLEMARLRGKANTALQLYESPQSNGFYFNAAIGFAADEFKYLLDYFEMLCAALGYRRQIAERRYHEHGNAVKCQERYYLKPELSVFEPPLDQLYGNVHLELIMLDEQPSYLKVMAHVYQDRNYKEPRSFESFLSELLSESQPE